MVALKMLIDTIPKVEAFVNCNTKFNGEVDVVSKRWRVNGKSILGVFSLPLMDELDVLVTADTREDYDNLLSSYRECGLLKE